MLPLPEEKTTKRCHRGRIRTNSVDISLTTWVPPFSRIVGRLSINNVTPPPKKKTHANKVRQEFFCENFPNWGLHQTQPPQKTTQTFSIWESQTKQKSHLGMLNPTQDASVTSPPGFWHSIINHVYGRHLKSITKKTSSTTSLRSCNCQDVLIQILGPPSSKSIPIKFGTSFHNPFIAPHSASAPFKLAPKRTAPDPFCWSQWHWPR